MALTITASQRHRLDVQAYPNGILYGEYCTYRWNRNCGEIGEKLKLVHNSRKASSIDGAFLYL